MSAETRERFELAKKTVEDLAGVRVDYTEILPNDVEADEAAPGATLTLPALERLAALLIVLRDQRFGEPVLNTVSFLPSGGICAEYVILPPAVGMCVCGHPHSAHGGTTNQCHAGSGPDFAGKWAWWCRCPCFAVQSAPPAVTTPTTKEST